MFVLTRPVEWWIRLLAAATASGPPDARPPGPRGGRARASDRLEPAPVPGADGRRRAAPRDADSSLASADLGTPRFWLLAAVVAAGLLLAFAPLVAFLLVLRLVLPG